MNEILNAVLAVVLGVGGMLLYYYGTNWLLDTFLGDRVNPDGTLTQRTNVREQIRPWLFLMPALILLTIYLLYPALATVYFSLLDERSEEFVGLDNYTWAIGNSTYRQVLLNNLLWVITVPTLSTALGLLIAVLADRVRWEAIAKALIFMPMAISFVGAAIIWRFVYAYRGPDQPQIGILNAIMVEMGQSPQAWLNNPPINSLMLMVILIWIQTGFAMVVLSSALKSVPSETLEAANIDGANEVQSFFWVMVPQIASSITVVMTTILITTLKVFDIVLVMTDGQNNTEVLGNYMYRWMFRNLDFGRASVIAITIMIATLPFLYWNLKRFREEEKFR